MTDCLIAIEGPIKGQKIPIEKATMVIGRIGCDITLSDPDVSRRHAEIRRTDNGYEIKDLKSSNKTLVDGIPVQRTHLLNNARVEIGRSVFVFITGELPCKDECNTADTISVDTLNSDPMAREAVLKDFDAMTRAQADLASLYRVGQMINSMLQTKGLFEAILKSVIEEMPKVDACSVHLLDEQTQHLNCKGHRTREGVEHEENPVFSRAILNMVLKERKAILTSDTLHDDRLSAAPSIMDLNIRSAMCVPLQSHNRLFGMLQADVLRSGQRLTEDDLRLLAAIGMQAGTVFENATLYEQLAAEKTALQEAHEKLQTAQNTLIRSEKLAAVGRMSAGIVHDVQNPMTVILCHVQMLLQSLTGVTKTTDDSTSIIESLKEIEAGVLQCNSVLNGLLQFAKQAKLEKTVVSPNTLIEDIVRFLAYEIKKAKANVTTDLKGDMPPVFADAGQIKQVLLNLLINAMQAMNSGGQITIATGVVEGASEETVSIRIRDAGCGMSPEVKSHLFKPFFTSKTLGEGVGGMGLGLSISHGIIKNHNGVIEVESELGQGTTFTIKLPAHRLQGKGITAH